MTEHRMREEKNIRQVFHLIFGWLKILLLVAFLERRKRNRGDTEEAGSFSPTSFSTPETQRNGSFRPTPMLNHEINKQ
ncbi:transmembrane protein, putative [Medicago truncatula]|uniref:Transmembrane protein, putative n=1 Tax=Medicago truncatula TaxID=3880 RepID=G7JAJ2_MEDTR|nr:transmembrane protein, putative [Medicago truncatula]